MSSVPAPVKFFNTLTRTLEPFNPRVAGQASIYTCGPTVYHYAHVGNMRAYVFADVLRRTLELAGYTVEHVMNITDVGHLVSDGDDGEDKMEVAKRREGKTAWDVAKYYEDVFFKHCAMLNIKRPHQTPRATAYIAEQIAMVEKLEAQGLTYLTDDGVYFDTSKFPDYGKLAKLDKEGLQAGKRVDNSGKRNKTDFALWKFSPQNAQRDMEWDSPWGKGFPGWHIECSAMATALLGPQLDIHTGGIDHIPVHHTNEIAQSECANGCSPFAGVWLHCNFLQLAEEKMSKSKGNIITVESLPEKGFYPLSFRYLCLTAHYRSELRFTEEAMQAAKSALNKLIKASAEYFTEAAPAQASLSTAGQAYADDFMAALAHDLNTAEALAVMWKMLGDSSLSNPEKRALLQKMDSVLGFDLPTLYKYAEGAVTAFKEGVGEAGIDVEMNVARRYHAKKNKDFATADAIRFGLTESGIELEDVPEGVRIKGESNGLAVNRLITKEQLERLNPDAVSEA